MVTVVAGSIIRVDPVRRVIGIGRQEVWIPSHLPLAELMGASCVSAVCEEREGKYWLMTFRAGLHPA